MHGGAADTLDRRARGLYGTRDAARARPSEELTAGARLPPGYNGASLARLALPGQSWPPFSPARGRCCSSRSCAWAFRAARRRAAALFLPLPGRCRARSVTAAPRGSSDSGSDTGDSLVRDPFDPLLELWIYEERTLCSIEL